MKKNWLVILALMLLVSSAFAYEVVAYQEDFESGLEGWEMYDGTESPNNWHIYDDGGTQGNAWWMGDPALASGTNIGGYYNHQYLVLDTPARTLTADNATLTFKLKLGLEEVGGTDEYDGWDSANIRISTDGGSTWTVITGSPAYHFESSYAFGSEHGEGPGVPGWGGITNTWTPASFDLSAYVGQSVKIRFAFASDPAYNTSDQPDMFGFMVDDIAFGGYSNNGVDDGDMTWSSLVPLGGQLWHLATEASAPSPTHVMKNQNNANTYNPNMLNYIVSPSITLPNDGDIRADFMIMGNFEDADYSASAPLSILDYWGWEISPDNGVTWNAMSNPYADPNGVNYVYVDTPDAWMSAVEAYTLDGYISDFAGQTVKFRWYFKSDDDAPIGTGMMIDDFRIYNDVFIAPPENLAAEVNEADVTLNWDAPGSGGGGGEEGWIHYDGDNYDAIGTGSEADFSVAAKWDALGDVNSIYPYVGMNITKIQFWPNEAQCDYSVRIWTGNQSTLVVDQAVDTVTIGAWNEVTLATPFTIPAATTIMAGYRSNALTGYPAGIDNGSATVEGYGNWINMGSWSTLTALADIAGNWNIRVYVADAEGREYVMGELPENQHFATGEFAKANISRNHRDVGAYKIYRDGEFISEVAGSVTTYTDTNVSGGPHNYYVTAMYGEYESSASNTQVVFIVPEDHVETVNDDGSAEFGLSLGSSRQMAVLHDEFAGDTVTIKYIKIYVETLNTAQFVIRLYEKDSVTGLPGTIVGGQIQYPSASIVPGWNYIEVPDERIVDNGEFFVALMETPNHSAIGVDSSTNGFSYTNMGTGWTPYEDGEIMIRAIVQVSSSNNSNVSPVLTLSASNYPNPFNPETTISFTVPQNGQTSVKVYNLKGQEVRSLLNKEMTAGSSSIVWNGTDNSGDNVASGLYFVRVQNNGKAVTRKMLLSK